MSEHRPLEPSSAPVEIPAGDADLAREGTQIGGWPLDRPFPLVLTIAQLCCVLQIHPAFYYRHRANFRRFQVDASVLGARAVRFSGSKVKAFVEGMAAARMGRDVLRLHVRQSRKSA